VTPDPRYCSEVLRRLRDAPGAGSPPPGLPLATGTAGHREQGVDVRFDLAVHGDRVVEARFRAFGCPHVIAVASWLTERLQGARREDLTAWDWQEAARALEVPPAKFGRLLTIQDAVRDAARNWPGEMKSTV